MFWQRLALGSLAATIGCAAVAVACSERAGTLYGQPSGLRSSNLPGEGGSEPVICGASVDIGVDGGPVVDDAGGACAVSFARDIYPHVTGEGAWRCAGDGRCHGAAQPPLLDAGTPASAYAGLRAMSVGGVPYLVDSGDPKGSSFLCNVSGGCGSPMPIAPGRGLTPGEICRIEAWLRCGAPNN